MKSSTFVRRERGAAFLMSVMVAFLLSMLLGGAVLFTSSNYSLAWSKNNSEAALLLAEAGVNWEMQYMSHSIEQMRSPQAHSPALRPGEPYKGYKGSIVGMPGNFWVYATVPGTTSAWPGYGPAQINCTAVVGGSRAAAGYSDWGPEVVKSVSVQVKPASVFASFALFALDASNNNSSPAIHKTGNSNVLVHGNVGSNSTLQGGDGEITFTVGYNYNSGSIRGGGNLTGQVIYYKKEPLIIPTVKELLARVVPPGTPDPWAWIASNNNNDKIRQYKKVNGSLSNSGTTAAGFSKSQHVLASSGSSSNLLVRNGSLLQTSGSWSDINVDALSQKRKLILPPGDYYLSKLDLQYDPTIELIVDNAGLTTPEGSNEAERQVRIWINGPQGIDSISLPIALTDPDNMGTFRIFYGKAAPISKGVIASELQFNIPAASISGPTRFAGAVYAVNNRLDPITLQPVFSLTDTAITFTGPEHDWSRRVILYGSLIADRVSFKGQCELMYPSVPIDNAGDPGAGVVYSSSCAQAPCYSDGGS